MRSGHRPEAPADTEHAIRLGRGLEKARTVAGLTRAEVAELSGISEGRLSRIENGTADTTVAELLAVCGAVGVTASALLRETTPRIRPKVTQGQLEEYLSAGEAAELLGISEDMLVRLCKTGELPHTRVKIGYLFRWTELDQWLDIQFNKRLPATKRKHAVKGIRRGIEPLLSEREINEIFGGGIPTGRDPGRFVPIYYIGRRKRYRLSDILAYIEYAKVGVHQMPAFSHGWDFKGFDREPEIEELEAKELERRFSTGRGREDVPGYEWTTESFKADSAVDVEERLIRFKGALEYKWQLGKVDVAWSGKRFSVDVGYLRIPPAWEGYTVKRTTKRADYQNLLKMRVQEFVAKNVPKGRLIEVRYFTDRFFFGSTERHCATIAHYTPADKNSKREPGSILNKEAMKKYETLKEESIIRVPHRAWRAIDDFREGRINSYKLTHLLREAGLFEKMDEADLLVYERRDRILDVLESSRPWEANVGFSPNWRYHFRQERKFARLVKMTAKENEAFEEEQNQRKEVSRRHAQKIALYYYGKLRPDAELLAELMEKYSNVTLGRIFEVSDVAVKKWMKSFGLTRKKRVNNQDISDEEILVAREEIKKRILGQNQENV